MSNFFYHLHTASDTPCHLTKEADTQARGTWLCPGCCSPKPGVTAIDARLRAAPAKEPLNFVFGAGLPIASKAFLDTLGNDLVQRELYLGRVYGPDGQELNEWATFRGKHRLIVRGSKNAQHRQCTECGQTLYFAMGKSYLYPAPLPGVNLFESNLWGLVLAEGVFLQTGLNKWQGFHVDKLSVVSTPEDSFGELT
jgi:hypothetical protein